MKINKIIIATIIFTTITFAQSGKVSYNVAAKVDYDKADNSIKSTVVKIVEFANKQQFELSFNKNQSSFKLINKLNSTDQKEDYLEKVSRLAFTSNSQIFVDKNKKTVLNDDNEGMLFTEKFDTEKWQILNDTRKIDNYDCYKAIFKEEFLTRNGEKTSREIVAWFAPSLPYSYGPKKFYGLPGLILELTEKNTTYLATKIELFEKEFVISFPKGKTITKEEYDKKLKAQMGM